MAKIKWGVIGCGGIAYRRTIPGMMLAENAELIAVMDANAQAAEKVKEKYPTHAVDGEEDILVVTNLGIIIRTSLKEVKVAGRNTLGVRIIRLINNQKL